MKTSALTRALLAALTICACAAPYAARAQARTARAERPAPRFEDYPVREVYRGRPAPLRLDSPTARMFRTRLREDSRTGPNFAGRYTFVFWGCGTGCAQSAVVDAATGRVFFPPLEFHDIPDAEDEEARRRVFRLDSRLLVLTESYYSGRTYTAYYYLFDGRRFRLLRKAVERRPEPEDSETQD